MYVCTAYVWMYSTYVERDLGWQGFNTVPDPRKSLLSGEMRARYSEMSVTGSTARETWALVRLVHVRRFVKSLGLLHQVRLVKVASMQCNRGGGSSKEKRKKKGIFPMRICCLISPHVGHPGRKWTCITWVICKWSNLVVSLFQGTLFVEVEER